MAVTQTIRLGCGRDVDELWDHIDEPPTDHEQSCPFCTQARASLTELSTATQQMTNADHQDSDLRFSPERLDALMTIVRTEVRRGRTIPLQRPAAAAGYVNPDQEWVPQLTVSEQAIAGVVRQTCDQYPEVEAGRVSIDIAPPATPTGHAEAPPPTELEPAEVVMNVQLTVTHTTVIPALLDRLRADIAAAVTTQIGVRTTRIDVDVTDIHDA